MLALIRLLRVLLHLLRGWAEVRLLHHRLDAAGRRHCTQRWAHGLLRILRVQLIVRGQPSAGPLLLVANHISWLDIVVVLAAADCRFVSKSEVHRWPFLGAMAEAIRTLFIERASRRDAMRVVHQMAAALSAGDVLVVFPEGTTTDGVALLPFHANLLQAAIAAQAPVQPLGLAYRDAASGHPSAAANYVGDDTLLHSIWRLLASPCIDAVLHFGPPHGSAGQERRALAARLQAEVDALRLQPRTPLR